MPDPLPFVPSARGPRPGPGKGGGGGVQCLSTLACVPLVGCEGGSSGAALLGALALLIVAAGGVAVGWLLARARLGTRLHDSAREARLVPTLSGALAWRSDAEHRLSAGPLGATGSAPWAGFASDAASDRFRTALESRAGVDAMTLVRGHSAWVVAAAPLYDRDGAFEGHLGIARAVADDGSASRPLAWLADAAPGAVWAATRPAEANPAPWRVVHANEAARGLFGEATTVDDEAVTAALPASLRPSWAAGEDTADGEGWCWRRTVVDGRQVALVWQPAPASASRSADDSATLSYTVSHDLRAPIRVVEGFTRILKEDYGSRLDRIANDHLDRVLGATARMNQMIDAMLTLARLSTQPLTRQPVNLSQLAGWVVDDLRRASPERKAEVDIEPALQVHGDPTLLRLVLENLIGNAWKYSAQRATARISLTRESVDGAAVFVVRDNGAGFDMRGADRLFGLFQRLHSASEFPGTGVGLASVRRIVQRHGGDVWATGEPDRGAAFHFSLRD